MKIAEGKSYKAADGRKISNMRWSGEHRCFYGTDERVGSAFSRAYRANGKHGSEFISNEPFFDLVSEWEPTGPVVTETVKRINPGIYGKLNITGTYQKNRVTLDWVTDDFHSAPPIVGLDAAELRAAAATLTELADALDEGATCRS